MISKFSLFSILVTLLFHSNISAQGEEEMINNQSENSYINHGYSIPLYINQSEHFELPPQEKVIQEILRATFDKTITPYWTEALAIPMTTNEFLNSCNVISNDEYGQHLLEKGYSQIQKKSESFEEQFEVADFEINVEIMRKQCATVNKDTPQFEIVSFTLIQKEKQNPFQAKRNIASFSFREINQQIFFHIEEQYWTSLIRI